MEAVLNDNFDKNSVRIYFLGYKDNANFAEINF